MVCSHDTRKEYEQQIFWVGECKDTEKLTKWFSYVCRNPLLPGHIIVQNTRRCIEEIPHGLEEAVNLNIDFILEWSCKNKAKNCYPVFFKMNIEGEWFRVHVIPVSEQEKLEATRSLCARHPKNTKPGGFLFYLGKKEDMAERCIAKYNEVKNDKEKELRLMEECGITEVVKQLRNIVKKYGYRSSL